MNRTAKLNRKVRVVKTPNKCPLKGGFLKPPAMPVVFDSKQIIFGRLHIGEKPLSFGGMKEIVPPTLNLPF